MGVYLTPIIVNRKKVPFEYFSGRRIAFDANNELYQFLALIRQPDGRYFSDSKGRPTSHLMGLFYRTTRLTEYGIFPIFVFDGKPHPLKLRELDERKKLKEKAEREWLEALFRGDLPTAWRKAIQTSRLTSEMIKEAKELLDLMGIPWVQAPSDAEAQAAYIVRKGDAFAVCSRDWDSLLYGTNYLVRYLTISGTEFLPSKGIIKPLEPEIIDLMELLSMLKITREQLIDIAILVGTDYNEGVEGIGPKRALEIIRKYGTIENAVKRGVIKINEDYNTVRKIFLEPEVTDDYQIEWNKPDKDGIISFLCDEKDFSRKRVENAIRRLEKLEVFSGQKKLFDFIR